MEISTRQSLAPRPPVPIVRQDMTDPRVIRENAERVAFGYFAWDLLNTAHTLKEARVAFKNIRKKLFDPRNQTKPRPDGGWLMQAYMTEYRRLDDCHARRLEKQTQANSASAEVNTH